MVTEMDHAAEAALIARILAERPDDHVLAEEGGATVGTTGVRWVIDPLDGTTNYLYGLPVFAVSIAAQDELGTVAAVVHDPVHGETFTATRGGVAALDDESITPSRTSDVALALVGTGFAYVPERRAWQAKVLTHLLPRVRDVRRAGSAALDLCWVACGRLDATYERGLAPWDHAAAAFIASQAGAIVRHVEPGDPFGLVMSATPCVGDAFFALVANAESQAGPRPD